MFRPSQCARGQISPRKTRMLHQKRAQGTIVPCVAVARKSSNRSFLSNHNVSLVWTMAQKILSCVGESGDLSSPFLHQTRIFIEDINFVCFCWCCGGQNRGKRCCSSRCQSMCLRVAEPPNLTPSQEYLSFIRH